MEYFKNLYSIKLENLKEMEKLLDLVKLPKLNQEGVKILNRPITSERIETVIIIFKKKLLEKETKSNKTTRARWIHSEILVDAQRSTVNPS